MKSEKYKKKSRTIVRLFFLVTRTRIGKLRLSICFANILLYVPFAAAKDGRFEFDSRPFGFQFIKKTTARTCRAVVFGEPTLFIIELKEISASLNPTKPSVSNSSNIILTLRPPSSSSS